MGLHGCPWALWAVASACSLCTCVCLCTVEPIVTPWSICALCDSVRALHCLQAVWEQWLSPVDGLRRPLYLTRPPEWDTKAKRPKAKPKAKAKAKSKAASEAAPEAGGPDPSVNAAKRRRRRGASPSPGPGDGAQGSSDGSPPGPASTAASAT